MNKSFLLSPFGVITFGITTGCGSGLGGIPSNSSSIGPIGSGGGGGGQHTFSGTAGHGGDGVVIVRLLTADYSASTITGTHTTTTIGSETAVKWTGNGTLVTP